MPLPLFQTLRLKHQNDKEVTMLQDSLLTIFRAGGEVINGDCASDFFTKLSAGPIDLVLLSEAVDSEPTFLDLNFEPCEATDPACRYKLLPTGHYNTDGRMLYLSYKKCECDFAGVFVGDFELLAQKALKAESSRPTFSERAISATGNNKFWNVKTSNGSDRLFSVALATATRAADLLDRGDLRFLRLNRTRSHAIFTSHIPTLNGGWLTIIGRIYQANDGKVRFTELAPVGGLEQLDKLEFDIADRELIPRPIIFGDNPDFFKKGFTDMSDLRGFIHGIRERGDRISGFSEISEGSCFAAVTVSLQHAELREAGEPGYIQPFYSPSAHKIQYLAPLFLDCEFDGAPAAALVLDDGVPGRLKTVLTMSDALTDAVSLSPRVAEWLTKGDCL